MFDLDADAPNVVPSRYRQVSVALVPSLDPDELVARFTGREAYRRTRFVIVRLERASERCALVELARGGGDELFAPARAARVLAAADECVYVRDDRADPGIASHLAAVAERNPDRRCVVVEGRYRHVSFILNADPVRVSVVDVVPPLPSKLVDQVSRVLDTAEELPPVVVSERIIDSRDLLLEAGIPLAEGVLVPCRGGGVDIEGASVSHLDERPEAAGATLLGCQRSQQIHRWFYGVEPVRTIDWCPRRLLDAAAGASPEGGAAAGPILSRCCMLEEGMERRGDAVLVPWGATLAEVRRALDSLIEAEGGSWTHT